MRTCAALWVTTAVLACFCPWTTAKPLTIVEHGKSTYSIYHAADAPSSVKDAAKELQTYVAKATGAKLLIVNKLPNTPVIALGVNELLKTNGLSLDGVKTEGYRIVTKGANVFIFGEDTPDKQLTTKGGFSRGTQNGVYTFLETVFGIRWLMPGDLGDYVPKASTVEMPAMSLTDAPDFQDRRIEYLQVKDPRVVQWMLRNKLGYSIRYMHGHNWDCFTSGVYDFHPDVFTLHDGQRIRPVGANAWLCTSNQETVRFMGLRQVGYFHQAPVQFMGSVSPTDGHGMWCECPQCTALDEKLPNGEVLHTKRIITFYNDVTRFVAEKFPDKALGGYIYLDYVDPPVERSFRFHPNFYPVFAPAFIYGPLLYRPEAREHFHAALDGWAAVVQDKMCFYGLPRFLQGTGRFAIPVPPGRKIIGDILPALKKARFIGVRVDGMNAWGFGGAYNWTVAKLMWKADTDVNALCDEYYAKCYGKGGPAMSAFDGLLEERTEKYIASDATITYHMNPKAIKAIYLPVYSKLEEFYKQAEAATDTEETKKRLELFGWSMRGLYRVLEDYGWLMNAKDSKFYVSEPDFMKWLMTQKDSIYIAPGALVASGPLADTQNKILHTPVAAKALHDALPNAEPAKPFIIRFKNHLVLFSDKEGEVRVSIKLRQSAKGGEVAYKVYDQTGNVVTSGQAADEKEFTFLGAQGGLYHLFLDSQMIFVNVTGASWAIDTRYSDFMRLGQPYVTLAQEMTPFYFYVPKGTPKFSLSMSTLAPGETCAATLYDPQNKPAAEFDTTKTGKSSSMIQNERDNAGFWKLVIGPAKTGTIDKVFLELGPEIPGYVCPDPANRLVIEKLK